MSHTYINQFLHILWSTKNCIPFLSKEIQLQLYPYISTIISHHGGSALSIGGTLDHIHLLCYNISSNLSTSNLLREIKSNSSGWLRQKFSECQNFAWESGYGSFSVSDSKVGAFKSYIKSQEQYHHNCTYEQELKIILEQHNISYHKNYFLENSHSCQIYHLVWSTYEREPMINLKIKQTIYEMITSILTQSQIKLLAIGGVSDHVHILLNLPAKYAISDVIRNIKSETSNVINQANRMCALAWQDGYGAFTVSASLVETVKNYILNQEEHHRVKDYQTEMNEFMSAMLTYNAFELGLESA